MLCPGKVSRCSSVRGRLLFIYQRPRLSLSLPQISSYLGSFSMVNEAASHNVMRLNSARISLPLLSQFRPVWLALTLVYLLAIFPLAYTDQLTLKYLIRNPAQIENMFWYVFGTFTNSLTFQGEKSWSNSKKSSTRILIGETF